MSVLNIRRIQPPAISKCPSTKGEEWPTESYKSYISAGAKVITHEDITFTCPAGHTFTLKKAVERGMFTPEEAFKMMALAQDSLPVLRKQCSDVTKQIRNDTQRTRAEQKRKK